MPNSSDAFDYYENNARRLTTATTGDQGAPGPAGGADHQPAHELVVPARARRGAAVLRRQLHTSIPNTSGRARYSVDFRTVDVPDLMAGRGAPLVDVHCTGTAIRDFHNVADGAPFRRADRHQAVRRAAGRRHAGLQRGQAERSAKAADLAKRSADNFSQPGITMRQRSLDCRNLPDPAMTGIRRITAARSRSYTRAYAMNASQGRETLAQSILAASSLGRHVCASRGGSLERLTGGRRRR